MFQPPQFQIHSYPYVKDTCITLLYCTGADDDKLEDDKVYASIPAVIK
jgi:hypothetical protein